MFLNLNTEVSTEELMKAMLSSHSPNYILYLLAKCYNYHSPEWFADKLSKILDEVEEDE